MLFPRPWRRRRRLTLTKTEQSRQLVEKNGSPAEGREEGADARPLATAERDERLIIMKSTECGGEFLAGRRR
jgi:hypothetical protein